MKRDLFEDVAQELPNCQYISDLKAMLAGKNKSQLRNVLVNLHYNDYSVNQWNELIHYLFEVEEVNLTSEEAYKKLCDYLEK